MPEFSRTVTLRATPRARPFMFREDRAGVWSTPEPENAITTPRARPFMFREDRAGVPCRSRRSNPTSRLLRNGPELES